MAPWHTRELGLAEHAVVDRCIGVSFAPPAAYDRYVVALGEASPGCFDPAFGNRAISIDELHEVGRRSDREQALEAGISSPRHGEGKAHVEVGAFAAQSMSAGSVDMSAVMSWLL